MKLIFENWRRQSGEYDFEILCENFDRGLITEIELYETWDRQVMTEMQSLIDEGVMDTLKKGYEAIKGGVKEEWELIKDAYNAAAEKVSDFILKLQVQAWQLLQTAKVIASKIAAVLMKVVNFVKKFCGVHPLLCKVTLLIVIMISITAVMAMMAAPAMADVTGPGADAGTYKITDTGVNAIRKCLEIAGRKADPEVQQHTADALQWIDKAHAAETMNQIIEGASQAQDEVFACYRSVEKIAAKDPGFFQRLAAAGEKVLVINNDYHKVFTGAKDVRVHVEWDSIVSAVGEPNVSPLNPGARVLQGVK